MNISEKVAYLKGLAEGLDLGDGKEAKVLAGILDVLEDICEEIYDVEDYCEELSEQLDAVDEDLSVLEDEFYGDDDECSCGCGCGPDCDCGCQEGGECTCGCDCDCDCDDECYEVECPNCQDVIYLDEEMIEEGKMVCPNCGVELEFDFDDCDCDCGCGCNCDDEDK